MVYDYSRAVAMAQRMVAKFGRPVTMFAHDAPDPNNPLGGLVADPVQVPAIAVFVEPSSLQSLGINVTNMGGLWTEDTQIAIIAPTLYNGFVMPLEAFQEVLDKTKVWKIVVASKFEPGDTTLLYYMGLKR